jgi:hypothetical protein
MRVLKKRNRITKSLAYTTLVRPILEYGSACLDPCRERQINALDRVEKKAAQFTNNTKDSEWETLAQRRTIACLCTLFKAYCGGRTWKALRDRWRRIYYLSRIDHVRKIRDGKQRTDIGKYCFVNRTTRNWNQLSAETLGTFPCKTTIFSNRVRKTIMKEMKWNEWKCGENNLKCSEVKWGEV